MQGDSAYLCRQLARNTWYTKSSMMGGAPDKLVLWRMESLPASWLDMSRRTEDPEVPFGSCSGDSASNVTLESCLRL